MLERFERKAKEKRTLLSKLAYLNDALNKQFTRILRPKRWRARHLVENYRPNADTLKFSYCFIILAFFGPFMRKEEKESVKMKEMSKINGNQKVKKKCFLFLFASAKDNCDCVKLYFFHFRLDIVC